MLVAPSIELFEDEVVAPWVIEVGDDAFALDLLRSLPASKLLERTGRAPTATVQRMRRALRQIT